MAIKYKRIKILLCLTIISLLSSTFIFASNPFEYPVSAIFLDAGHGGSDPGANRFWNFYGKTINEKDITLSLSFEVEKNLKNLLPNIEIYQTRETDEYLSLQERSSYCYTMPLQPKSRAIFISLSTLR